MCSTPHTQMQTINKIKAWNKNSLQFQKVVGAPGVLSSALMGGSTEQGPGMAGTCALPRVGFLLLRHCLFPRVLKEKAKEQDGKEPEL